MLDFKTNLFGKYQPWQSIECINESVYEGVYTWIIIEWRTLFNLKTFHMNLEWNKKYLHLQVYGQSKNWVMYRYTIYIENHYQNGF